TAVMAPAAILFLARVEPPAFRPPAEQAAAPARSSWPQAATASEDWPVERTPAAPAQELTRRSEAAEREPVVGRAPPE
ncbi:MAG: hypothetical protein ACOVVK_06490, partial [Elsteraceae bacterium]